MNLFSSFDPLVYSFPINWLSALLFFGLMPTNFWKSKGEFLFTFRLIMKTLLMDLKNLVFHSKILIFLSLFMLIMLTNFLGLFPYIFTSSTHLVYGLALGLPLWLGYMLNSLFLQTEFMLAHFVPLGTPVVLQPFMVLIEIISNVIRPLTLGIRLMANMMAGHLLLTLLGAMSNQGVSVLILVLLGMMLILLLELGVAVIQAYVFTLLSTLYVSEMNSIKMNKLN